MEVDMSLQVTTYLLCRGLGPVYTFLLSAPKTWSPCLLFALLIPWKPPPWKNLEDLNLSEEPPLNLSNLAFPVAALHGAVLSSKSIITKSRKRITIPIFWFFLFTQIMAWDKVNYTASSSSFCCSSLFYLWLLVLCVLERWMKPFWFWLCYQGKKKAFWVSFFSLGEPRSLNYRMKVNGRREGQNA